MSFKKRLCLISLICFLFSTLYGQEAEGADPESSTGQQDAIAANGAGEAGDESGVYYIRTVTFDIEGRTKEGALAEKGEFVLGEYITGRANLENYIDRKTQLLLNQRVLEEVHIAYTLAGVDENGLIPVDLFVNTEDTLNIIVLPEPKYDSNSGFEITLKARDYNFLGSMVPLRLDLGYSYDENNEQGFLLGIDSDLPFRALGYAWNLNFDNEFNYTEGSPFYYKNTTGLSMDLPFKMTTITFGFNQSILVNEENNTSDAIDDGSYFQDRWYMRSELYSQWKIPLGITVGGFGPLTYTPQLAGSINYRPGGDIGEYREGPSITPSQSLGFGQINWLGNYRKGLEVSLQNSNTYQVPRRSWTNTISVSAIGHLPLSADLGISGRFMYRHWFFDSKGIPTVFGNEYFRVYSDGGDALRGIKDNQVPVNYMLSLNLDFPVRLFRFFPSEWYNNPKLHFFDFELHGSPFIDIALAEDPVNKRSFSFKDALVAGGVEVIVFPLAMRSFYLRASLGMNMREFFRTGRFFPSGGRELFIGVGHYY
ncbi:MAG: hypothetical protein LBC60_06620 [Spirochaetaceae bacterium]|jgi:hypothetical protein|nr:hypothetical protein [Spirochaetaceae bacterium]